MSDYSSVPDYFHLMSSLYHERQSWQLCLLHTLNNLLQHPRFSKPDLDRISKKLHSDSLAITTQASPGILSSTLSWLQYMTTPNPHRAVWGTGNYDVNVLECALREAGCEMEWFDKRRSLQTLFFVGEIGAIEDGDGVVGAPASDDGVRTDRPRKRELIGIILNDAPRNHWFCVRPVPAERADVGPSSRDWWNLDSKLEHPERIGGDERLMGWLEKKDFQVLLVYKSLE